MIWSIKMGTFHKAKNRNFFKEVLDKKETF